MFYRRRNLTESEQLEVSIIEKNQRSKPKAIDKRKKEGAITDVTIEVIGCKPDSTRALLGPSYPSIATYDSSSTRQTSEESLEDESTDSMGMSGQNILQLRKEVSIASRPGQKDDIFQEIELSEDETDYLDPTIPHTMEDDSEGSESSMRVTTGKTYSTNERRKMRQIDLPFLAFWEKNREKFEEPWGKSETPRKQQIDHELTIVNEIISTLKEMWKDNEDKPGGGVSNEEVKELFRFGSVETAFNSISIDIKELTIVPEVITEGNYPELEERAALYMQILFDEMAFWKIERSMAFGTLDPRGYKRPKNQPLVSWTMSGLVPESLTTGEYLYESLIKNESRMLERYILWMVENPSSYRPSYVVNSGYFHKVIGKYAANEEEIRKKFKMLRNVPITAEKYLQKSEGKRMSKSTKK